MQSPASNLASLLRTEGPQTPAQIMRRLGISQPTLFRAVKKSPGRT